MDTLSRRVVIVVGSLVAFYGLAALAKEYQPALAPTICGVVGYALGIVVRRFWSPAQG